LKIDALLEAQTPRVFRPSDTDPEITDFDNRQYAYIDETATVTKDKLVVLLPGTTGTPFFYREFLRYAATLGYHSLGLMYPNNKAVGTLCAIQDRRNPNCPREVRLEIIDGTDRTSLVEVDRVNSIENRLIRALEYLDTIDSTEGWDLFLKQDGSITWDRIVICGHSQGGGHAAMIAKRHLVDRSLIFAAADWFPFEDRPADWASETSATPAHKVYVFAHLRDPLVTWNHLLPFFRACDLDRFGEPVSVESDGSLQNRHILTTDVNAENFHNAMIVDPHTPKDPASGEPSFQGVWKFMLLSETPILSYMRQ
jgi:pimeloyl-ACP methyl ester carboxylesterase